MCNPIKLGERLTSALKEIEEWKRGDVGKANEYLSERCVNAEREVRELREKLNLLQTKLRHAQEDARMLRETNNWMGE